MNYYSLISLIITPSFLVLINDNEANIFEKFFNEKKQLHKNSYKLVPFSNLVLNNRRNFDFNKYHILSMAEEKIEKRVSFYNRRIYGTIVDIHDKPVEFAQVSLFTKDSIFIKNQITQQDGNFNIEEKNGEYLLQVSFLGKILYSKHIIIDDVNNLNLGIIKIQSFKELEGVTVTLKKKLIERKVDRLVFNVENSILSAGVDLTQVLKGTPMLSISDFGISLVGKSSVSVMIDDRIVNMSGTDLMNYLKSLRSDDIAKIEVITAPPAKYEAQGNSGIVNIILKKNTKLGWSGNLSSSYVQTTYSGYANNLSLNYLSKKLHTTFRVRQYNRAIKSIENIDVVGGNSVLASDTRKDMENGVGANLNMSYSLNKKTKIGFIYDLASLNTNMNIENISIYKTNKRIDSLLNTSSKHRNPNFVNTLSTYFDYKIDSLGKRMNIGMNYFSNTPKTTVNFQTFSNQTNTYEKVRNTSKINYAILSGQVDFNLPFKKIIIETGLKFTNFKNNSDVQYFTFNDQNFILDANKSNLFNYDENNYAAYLSMTKDLAKKWSIKAGLRYEYSGINGFSKTTNKTTKYSYGNLFPTFYVSHKINDNNTLNFNYSRRINRPNFRSLNPFRWYSNPYTFSTGNPLLLPSYNHNVELTYLFKDMFSISVYGQKMVNGYGRIVSLTDAIKEVNYKNFLTQFDVGSNAGLFVNPMSWWEFSANATGSYSESNSSIIQVSPQNGFSFNYDLNNTFTINKAKQFFLFLNFWHSLPSTQGNLMSQNLSSLSTGFRFSLLNKKLKINTSIDDIFKGLISKGAVFFNEFTQFYNNYYDARRVTINITYTFGNKNVNRNNKQVQFDDRNRAN